ncbi:MAG TPA: VCBS repeat-containing protein [Polyangiaceae bacterium]|nr:VCBS repeat-containing protein [Polyangiaceae bacterium]
MRGIRTTLIGLSFIALAWGGCSSNENAGTRAKPGPDGGDGGGPASGGANGGDGGKPSSTGGRANTPADGGPATPVCALGTSAGAVQKPTFVRNLSGETSWFASPVVVDLDHDGKNELVAAYYSLFVYDASGKELAKASDGAGRVYAPHVVADLDDDGTTEIVVGNDHQVIAYEWKGGKLAIKSGWPADVTTANNPPEVRGLAAADLDGDGRIEVVATTTQTAETSAGGAQVFVFDAGGQPYQPAGLSFTAWPRYNSATGPGNDGDRNGVAQEGYGCYGLNVGIGNIDDDPALEIVVTYDNHQIQAFDPDGVALDASPWFGNPSNDLLGNRMTWGQFIRWADPAVEQAHYHDHTGDWPSPTTAEWLQWTASPPSVADLDGDGKNEVVGVPNVEMHEPYETQAYAVMVLEGAQGDGSRSAMRKAGWETLPRGDRPNVPSGYYPPLGVPAPTIANVGGDASPEILVGLNDGYFYGFSSKGERLFRTDVTFGKARMFTSEATVADLNQDGIPEILLATFGDPDVTDSGHLVVLASDGSLLFDVPLPNPGHDGNGNGAPAAPAVGDLDGDGALEIFVQTFDHGMDVFTVKGSAPNCVLWSTARGGPLRTGAPN